MEIAMDTLVLRKSELYTDIDRYFRKKISIVIEQRLRK